MDMAFLSLLLTVFLQGQAADPSPAELLKSIDEQSSSFKDLTLEAKLVIHEAGPNSVREVGLTIQAKGGKRIIRFTSPEDIKGMGFLLENADTMYAILPAFGNRIRRLGTKQIGQSFMGSDFSSADFLGGKFSEVLDAKLVSSDAQVWLLNGTAKAGKESEYSSRTFRVEKSSRRLLQIEDFGAEGKKGRTVTFDEFKKVEGDSDCVLPGLWVSIDHLRKDHKSELRVLSAKANQGLGDELFKKEALVPK